MAAFNTEAKDVLNRVAHKALDAEALLDGLLRMTVTSGSLSGVCDVPSVGKT